MPQLNSRQLKFCREYVKSGNANQSAIRAGYGERGAKQHGWQLLQLEHVKAEIERLRALPQLPTEDNTLVQPPSEKFSVEDAMAEANEALEIARDKRDPEKIKSASEYKSKLMGLLKDKNQDEVPITINIDVGKPCPKCGHIDEPRPSEASPST